MVESCLLLFDHEWSWELSMAPQGHLVVSTALKINVGDINISHNSKKRKIRRPY